VGLPLVVESKILLAPSQIRKCLIPKKNIKKCLQREENHVTAKYRTSCSTKLSAMQPQVSEQSITTKSNVILFSFSKGAPVKVVSTTSAFS
jgi:Cft2 family RNA processing exonuclease